MKKASFKVLSVVLVLFMTFTSAPLSGFIGIELPEWANTSIKAEAAVSNNWAWPTTTQRITGTWPKYAGSGDIHSGIDFGASLNSPVYSTCDGEVDVIKKMTTSYGNHIIIKANVNSSTVYMYYCHLNSINVSEGQKVSAGQLIGYSGNTGNSSGPHLHYEVRNANKNYGSKGELCLNPNDYLPGTKYTYETNGSTYDADAAIAFAKAHCAADASNHTAKSGVNACDNGWLCAEFVAECLIAGGFPTKLSAVAGLGGFGGQITNYGSKITSTKTGAGYVNMSSFSRTLPKGTPIVLLYGYGYGSGNGHVVIYSGETASDGTLLVYAHNKRNQNEKLYADSRTVEIFAVDLSGFTLSECTCSTSYAGTYTCTTSSANLIIRSGHGSSYSSIGSIPSGATVSVSKANSNWAHITYNGITGYASMQYLAKKANSGTDPIGCLDHLSAGVGTVNISGWAFDNDNKNSQLELHVYIGGPAGDSNAEGHNSIVANVNRPDVNNVYGCGDYHGFSATINTNKTGAQDVYVYAINVGGGSNALINSGTVTISPKTYNYSFSFNANGGTLGSTGAFTVSYGQSFEILNTTCTRSGYEWAGWTVKRNNDNKWYAAGQGWLTEGEINANGYLKQVYGNYETAILDESWVNGISGNASYTFYAVWIQERASVITSFFSPLGDGYYHEAALNNRVTSGVAQDFVYAWFVLYDENTGDLLNSYTDCNYESNILVYDPNGTLVHEYTYDSSDSNWIGFYPQQSGVYTVTAKITGDIEAEYSAEYDVYYDAQIIPTNDTIALSLNGDNSVTTMLTVAGNLPGECFISYSRGNDDVFDAAWGEWDGDRIPITFTGKEMGTTYISISVHEGYTGDDNIVETIEIPIIVTVNSSLLDLNSSNSAKVTSGAETVYYTYTSDESKDYVIYSTGDADTKIYLYNSLGEELGNDDDGGDNRNFKLQHQLEAGETYLFGIKYYDSSLTGTIPFKFGEVYNITYNSNSGSGAPSAQTKIYGTNLTLSSTKPTRTGYTFTGWNTKADGSGTSYAAGATYTSNAAVTLYAQWKINTFAVSYNANGGSGAPSAQTKTYGTNLTLSTTKPTRTGYTFTGWNTKADGSGTGYSSGATYTTNAALTLYAQWKIDTYTISYALNGGSVATANPTSYNVTTASFTLNNPTRTGYTFAGWTGTGLSAATKTVTVAKGSTGNRSYTATWTANTGIKYVVNHYQMNVSGSEYTLKETENKTGTTASSVTVANLKKTYAGFTYEGGKGATTATATKPSTLDTTTTVLADGTRVINLYYSRNKYTLTLNKGTGISAVTGAGTYYYGQSVTIDATVASGYTWSKWSDNNTTKKATITMPANALTLTANATLNSYTISYTLNGGSVTTANPTSYNVTTAAFTINNPTKTGYTFEGWTGTGLSSATKTVTVAKGSSGNRSYTANWTANTYTVTFNANGGTCSTANKTVTYASTYGTLPTPTKTGYVFNGWYTSSSGGTKITSSTNVSITANQTLYAQWTEIVLTSVTVKTNPTVVNYYVGDTLNTGGLTLTAKYSDGSTKTISNGFTCTPSKLDTAGTQKITVTYGGKTTSFNVTVEAVALASIAVKTNPTKTNYCVGDTLNTSGLTLTATYNNGTTKTISSGFTCTPTTFNTVGAQRITVTYGGKTTSFNVTVEAVALASIAVKTNSTKTNYYLGDTLDTSGLTLTATYNNGKTETISSGFTCTPTKLETAGTQKITVTYGGKTISFNVTVEDVVVSSIAVKNEPNNISYYVGDSLDTTGLTLTATYNNGTSKTITSGFTCTPTTLSSAGTQKITVTYGGKTTSFNVTVENVVLTSVAVKTVPAKTSYFVGDTLDTSGLTLTATYNNGATKTVNGGFACTPENLETTGTQKITVAYGDKSTSFNVEVKAVEISGISIASVPETLSYYVGDTLSTEGLAILVTYNNGTTKTVTNGFTCSPSTLNTEGTQKITVTYGGKTATFNVSVAPVKVTELEIVTAPQKTSYKVGDKFDPTGLTMNAVNSKGEEIVVTEGFVCTPEILEKAGTQVVTVSYGGKSIMITVVVEEEKAETYVVKFISNGVVISEEEYEAGEAIVKPADPALAGYKFMGWTPDVPTVMPEEALTFTAKFEKSYICPDCGDEILGEAEINAHIAAEARMKATVKIKNNPGSRTIKYGEILRLTAITNNMPADAKIYWYVDGVKRGEGTTFEVSPTSGSVQVTVKLVDSRGNVLENANGDEISDSQKVAVKAGFFQKLISFFKNLFGMNRTLVQVIKTF